MANETDFETASAVIVGSIVSVKGAVKVFADVMPEELTEPWSRYYSEMREYWRTHPNPDWDSYLLGLSDKEMLREVGIASSIVPTTDTDQLVEALRTSNLIRKAKNIGSDLATVSTKEDVEELANSLSKAVLNIQNTPDYGMTELFYDYLMNYEKKPDYLRIGMPSVDKYTYMERGDYIVIAGRPSSGKTAFSLQVMLKMAEQGIKCKYFSYETTPAKIFQRLLACYSGLPYDAIKQRKLTPQEEEIQAEAGARLAELPLRIVNAAGRNADWIKTEAIRTGAEAIFVDYLQLIPGGKRDDRYATVTNNSMALHTLAQSQGITVFVLSQLNRPQRMCVQPTIINLRESGQIEADADLIMLLWNEKAEAEAILNKNEVPRPIDENIGHSYWVCVAKNKEGLIGDVDIKFDGDHQRFYEYERRYG